MKRGSPKDVVTTSSDPIMVVEYLDDEVISDDEHHYIDAARAANTLRGYRSDWKEFSQWCAIHRKPALPASPSAVSTYLTFLARHEAKVGTMSRRLSAIKFAHRIQNLPDPTTHARVVAVWDGIRKEKSEPPDQATPLMPPELWDVLDACPSTRTWRTRPPEPDLAGTRDRALILVGFVGALRRSELSALDVEHLTRHRKGYVLHIPRSKTNQLGDKDELVVLRRQANQQHCPVTLLREWLTAAHITAGPVFRPVSKGNRPLDRRLTGSAINTLIQQAVERAGLLPQPRDDGEANSQAPASSGELDAATADPDEDDKDAVPVYSAHSLRAGFVTYAHLQGQSDRAIAHQTRHRSLASIGTYVRVENAWKNNAAADLTL